MKGPVVCIDCSPLLVRSAGVKTYLYHWLRALRAASPDNIRTFLSPSATGGLQHNQGVGRNALQLATLAGLNRSPRWATALLTPSCDVFHVSNLLRSPPPRVRVSGTIHDLTAWIMPEFHRPATLKADAAFADLILKRAAGVIANSENTKLDAIRILGIDPDRVHTIHLGVAEPYFSVQREAIARVAARYRLSRPWFLFVGTIEPRKNIDGLLSAWNSLPRNFRENYDLVVAGMPGWNSSSTMQRLEQAKRDEGSIRYLGYVPESDVPGLTAGARSLVYPSFYEGFGIPVAQALACGCPVITSNVSSLPEITGGAALLVDANSENELAAAITRLGESDELAGTLARAGVEVAQAYTWERAAAESLRFFQKIMG